MTTLFFSLIALALIARRSSEDPKDTDTAERSFALMRDHMVTYQIEGRGVRDPRVLAAMRKIPRHRFVPRGERDEAYQDYPLPIGKGQTISQPYIVGLMSELLRLTGKEKVLEIGTGCGYQAAVLAEIAKEVYTIEIVPELARQAEKTLKELGYSNIHVRTGNGYGGWPEEAPFDAVIVTAAPEHIPQMLVDQLKRGGRIVIPVGLVEQDLIRGVKTEKGLATETIIPVRFVPLVGKEKK